MKSNPQNNEQPAPIIRFPNFHDKVWRIQNLYKIKTKDRKLIRIKFNSPQTAILNDIQTQIKAGRPIRHITIKPRQIGISTFWLLWWLDDSIFHRNTDTGVLAHKRESLDILVGILRTAYNSMPDQVKPKADEYSKHGFSFVDVNSKIFVSLEIRSKGIHNLHISEWCLCDDERVRASIGACDENRANITGESTGNGIANDGYETFMEAKAGQNAFIPRFFPWFEMPEYRTPLNGMILKRTADEQKMCAETRLLRGINIDDEQLLWRRGMRSKLKREFPKEYPQNEQEAFMTSAKLFFDAQKVFALIKEAKEQKEKEPYFKDDDVFTYFERPDKSDTYVAGADTAEGVGDPSVLKIINVTKRREAFRFRDACGVDVFASVCDRVCREFNNCLLAVERNNHGHAVILALKEIHKYPNLYRPDQIRNSAGVEKIGWETTSISRPMMLDALKLAVEGNTDDDINEFQPEILWHDITFLKELLTFSHSHGKYMAESNQHDDNVIATAIAIQMYRISRRSAKGDWKTAILIGQQTEGHGIE